MAALRLGWPPGFPREIGVGEIEDSWGCLEIKQRVCRPEKMRRDRLAMGMTLIRGARESPVTDRVDVKTQMRAHRAGATGPRGVIRSEPGFAIRPTLLPNAQPSGRRLNPSCRNRTGRSSRSSAASAAGSIPTETRSRSTADARSTSAQTPSPVAGEPPCLRTSRAAIRRAALSTAASGAVPVCVAHMNRTNTLMMCQGSARGQGKTMARQTEITRKVSTGVEPAIQKSPKNHRFERKNVKDGLRPVDNCLAS